MLELRLWFLLHLFRNKHATEMKWMLIQCESRTLSTWLTRWKCLNRYLYFYLPFENTEDRLLNRQSIYNNRYRVRFVDNTRLLYLFVLSTKWQQVIWCYFSECVKISRHTGRGLEVLLALVRGAWRQAGYPDPPSWTIRKSAEATTFTAITGHCRGRCYIRRGGWRTRHNSTFRFEID